MPRVRRDWVNGSVLYRLGLGRAAVLGVARYLVRRLALLAELASVGELDDVHRGRKGKEVIGCVKRVLGTTTNSSGVTGNGGQRKIVK